MAMTEATVNNSFEESFDSVAQAKVENNLGRDVEHLEIVFLGGYFGEVRDFDGIADDAEGYICIESRRRFSTAQVDDTDTFVVGGMVYFSPGGSAAAGKLRANYVSGSVAVGICTKIFTSNVAVEIQPFTQRVGGGNVINASEYDVTADASAGIEVTGLVPVGARIVDIIVRCTDANASGTLQLTDNDDTPADISDAINCAVVNVIDRAGTLENNIVDDDGLVIISAGAADRGVMTILWR